MTAEVIEERGDFRVSLQYDDSPEFPDFVQSAVVSTNDRYLDFNDSYGYGSMVRREWSEHASDVIERWLKIFHGARAVGVVTTRDTTYLALLTDGAQEYYGTPDDLVQECVNGDAETFQQWIDGDVWGYVVEKRTKWQRLGSDGEPVFLEDVTVMETWEEVSSLWGLYGREYAETEALAALNSESAE
jgi:hypothetical protein